MTKPFMLIVYGAIAVVVSLVMFGIGLTQLSAAQQTANSTAYFTASGSIFPGLVSVMGIFGMVIFVTMIGSGLAMIGGGTIGLIRGGGKHGGGHHHRKH